MDNITRIYLVRHGNTRWNNEQRYQGSSDQPLSPLGHIQAKQVFRRFQGVSLDAIYASPSQRAVDTIRRIADVRKMEIQLDARLKEIDFGDWEGKRDIDLRKQYHIFPDFLSDPDQYPHPGEHMFQDVQKRMVACVEDILKQNEGKQVLICSHLGSIRLLLMWYFQIRDGRMFKRILMENAGLTILEKRGEDMYLVSLNENAYLQK